MNIMNQQTYFHQYHKPRVSNPTYKSSNVQNSMTFFHDGGHAQPNPIKQPNRSYVTDAYSHRVRAVKPAPPPVDPEYRPRVESHKPAVQRSYTIDQTESIPRPQNSKLSNYGRGSLNMDQIGVYHKQSSPYNIINCKPKEYSDDIRQYPWYSVENKDDVYYRRMQDQTNEANFYNSRAKSFERSKGDSFIAGKHTYGVEPKMSYNPENKPKKQHFTAKMLNHMDELQHNLA